METEEEEFDELELCGCNECAKKSTKEYINKSNVMEIKNEKE